MNITQTSMKNPAGVAVAVAIILIFGIFSIGKLPVQLFPDIDEPQLAVSTGWRAASPKEMESEIVEPQEEVLQGLPGLKEMTANVNQGWSYINLTFGLDTDMQQTMIEVISRLNRLPPLPADANPPQVQASWDSAGGANQALSWFFIQLLPGTPGPVSDYQAQVEDIVKPRIEAIQGVAGVDIQAWSAQQLLIEYDPYRLADLGIQIPQLAAVAGNANDVSGGFVDVGRRKWTVRYAGRYTPEELSEQILDWREGRPVKLGDVATISVDRADRVGFSIQNGNPALGMRVDRASGANVLEALNAVKAEVALLREGPLKELGLSIHQSFDASVFIYRAIGLVTSNLFIGVMLAVGVLWWFLRQMRATLLVAIAIPVSLFATFVTLNLADRTLNVISLAGLAFAVGMVLDAAIVVLENIVRLRERGEPGESAGAKATAQVWGALVASTATTVAIFLPVIFLKDVEGQLFADLALTIAIAVTISLFIAVTVLPASAAQWLTAPKLRDAHTDLWHRLSGAIVRLTETPKRRWTLIGALILLPVLIGHLAWPKLNYLPPVRRDAVDAFFRFPPGANTDTIEAEIIQPMVARLKPYMDGVKEPALKNYYFIVWPGGGTIGARVQDQSRVGELLTIIQTEVTAGFPDTQAFASQGFLFGGFGGGRGIALHLQSRDTEALLAAARDGMGLISQKIPGAQVQPQPGTELSEPELRLTPNDQRISEVGWNRANVARVVRSMGDGVWVGEYFDGEKRMDIIVKAGGWESPEELESVPISTPSGAVVPLGELITLERTVGPSQMRRIDRRRTVTLQIIPPDDLSLEEAVGILQTDVEPQLKTVLPADGSIKYGGAADSLKNAVSNMLENFALAFLILFLLMAALFKSVKDSFLVLLTIPMATVGGIIAVQLLKQFTGQSLDLLTMIGFIILMGLVVNNAILLMHQTRRGEAEGLHRKQAIQQALNVRLRPIFMSTLTSIFGMLPLLLMPGAGSVIYRGLAAVIVGGMSVSMIFTLLLLPSLVRLGEKPPSEGRFEPGPESRSDVVEAA